MKRDKHTYAGGTNYKMVDINTGDFIEGEHEDDWQGTYLTTLGETIRMFEQEGYKVVGFLQNGVYMDNVDNGLTVSLWLAETE